VVVFNPLNPIVPTYMKTCEHVTIVSSLDIDAVCGSASGENYYAENYIMTQLDAPDFCGVGQLELGPTAI
jgi:hypothetical protein